MTSTPAGTTRARKTTKGKGLVVKRRFSTEGIHPYDEVKWVRKDVVQTDWRTGTINFEQRQVEFPAFWSDNAVTITTTKYFRGKEGSEGRESSLRQLIDRIVDTYVAAGVENKYFASKKDADIFSDELKWLLLNQHFAFNSPVWFNVGTKSVPQVSACFILAVDDTMDGILNWYKEEGLIFKGGSGAGLNLSNIRSSKEFLSSGGNASGPVSFMRGADASAGTIKSGGSTRRAAKMIVLDVDHPDIEEFVETKVREEDKIRALRDAGFDMDLGGKDIVSVQYQNANNSVRVDDAFMRAVQNKDTYPLIARSDGSVIEEVDAAELFTKIAAAAWACADPGIQYKDTINSWHTNPETGPITASNPCFPADVRVATDTGLVRIGDLVRNALEGEEVRVQTSTLGYTPEEKETVSYTKPAQYMVTGTNPVVKLTFSDGSTLKCTPNHRIATTAGWVEAKNLTQQHKLPARAVRLDRSMASYAFSDRVIESSETSEVLRGTQPSRWNTHLPEKWSEELGHYLGWLTGDGCTTAGNIATIYGNPEDKIIEKEHQKFLENILDRVPKISISANGTSQLRVGRKQFKAFLNALGVKQVTANYKTIPEAIFTAPEDVVCAYLRGLFDADGTVVSQKSKGTHYVGLSSSSLSLLQNAQELLYSLGILSRIYVRDTNKESGKFHYTTTSGEKRVYTGKATHDLRITGKDLITFNALVNFKLPNKSKKLKDIVTSVNFYDSERTVNMVTREDEGYELTFNIQEPLNHTYVVGGNKVVANCSEYLSLDNSSCNLASINLLKFYNEETGFDVEAYTNAVETIITAMDISICFGHFPTEKITKTTHDYRQLGIGYSNLGALLMTVGMPYDSEEGRMFAGGITSLMSAAAWRRSSELANIVGPYNGYKQNKTAHTNVIERHVQENAHAQTTSKTSQGAYIYNAAAAEWNKALTLGKKHGWRNAQTSLLAPTGTISFLMDCDTTGIEPDFSLVKHKKLVGGGSMKIVNQGVERALRNLGYNEHIIETAIEHVAQTGVIIGAPFIKEEHYDVFDCAVGERAISPDGHIHMMAAAQPFLSGSISKCVTGETLLFSADGLIRISSLYENEKPDNFRPLTMEVASQEGFQKTDAFYYGGLRNIKKLTTRSGHTIKGTPNHKVLVGNKDGLVWKTLAEIKPGDYVTHKYGTNIWSQTQASLRGFTPSASYGNQKTVTIPTEMTEELALLLGAYASEGHVTRSTWTVVITNSCEEVLEKVVSAWKNVFGVDAKITRDKDKCPGVIVHSKTIVEFLKYLNCGSVAANKRIPDAVLTSPKNVILEYLKGLALDAYTADVGTSIKWAILLDSKELLNDLQAVLTNLGIVHSRVSKYSKEYDKYFDEVYTTGENAAKMIKLVPFMENYKKEKADKRAKRTFGGSTSSIVPGLRSKELYDLLPYGTKDEKGVLIRTKFSYLNDPRTLHASRETLEKLADVPQMELPDWLNQVLKENLHFSPVESIEDAGKELVYDISVPDSHAFVANGIVNHNTVNIPEESTIEDIERIYMEGWKLGLKAIAVYRDNCKVGQPLSTKEAKQNDIGETNVVPIRRRLPQTRNSKTTKFVIGGIEGYLTTGEYDDGTLGEIFIRVSKQGSTLSGMMDGLAMAVSVGLQYGVPLETFVAKYINSSFDPAGMTTDVDIRIAKSLLDYMFRRLAIEYLPIEIRQGYGIYTIEERTDAVENGYNDTPPPAIVETKPSVTSHELDVPMCQTCGTSTYMQRSGSCYACTSCGNTTGCS